MDKLSAPKQDVVRRLRIVEGHLKKVITMVEDNTYCVDVLQQTAAIRSAIKKAEEVLLANHMNSCFVRALKSGSQKQAIDELLQIFKKV
jgi:DNA-binding FrmR family transcriptional regulator